MFKRLLSSKAVLGGVFCGTCTAGALTSSLFAKVAFHPSEERKFKLEERMVNTHDTQLYRFLLQDPDDEMGLSVASCVVVGVPDPSDPTKTIWRPYTPVSRNSDHGYFDLCVKTYPNGKVGKHLEQMRCGDEIKVKGPYKKFDYQPNMKKRIGMIAGGSGITPMLQVITEVLLNPEDKTQIDLLFCNRTHDDIILKPTLDTLEKNFPDRLHVHYMVERRSPFFSFYLCWRGWVGRPTADVIKKTLPPPEKDNLILVCGPPPMVNAISGPKKNQEQGELAGSLKDLGYQPQQVFKF